MRALSQLETASAAELLQWAIGEYGSRLAIATSFQTEGMVIVDIAARIRSGVRVFTLDTGRLPAETHQMIGRVRARYGIEVEIVRPDAVEVASMVGQHGIDLFYQEVPLRMLCCHIRKVRPMERKLAELDAWVTGLRREHTESRADVSKVQEIDGRVKLSPLADWTRAELEEYVRQNDVLLHPLYSAGYTSIGCAPCTRAVEPGAPERSGRWWWELDAEKECGVHFSATGKAERRIDVLVNEVLHAPHA
jgi:phosphoadenylyl-sulfate reductase (thioredoxin)